MNYPLDPTIPRHQGRLRAADEESSSVIEIDELDDDRKPLSSSGRLASNSFCVRFDCDLYLICFQQTLKEETGVGYLHSNLVEVLMNASAHARRGRLWSNVEPGTMRHQPGSVLGAVSLVAGTTVGAGILALPATTEPAGFTASAAALTGGAVYAMITALMLAEVNLNTLCDVGAGGVSIVTMASRTLGEAPSGTIVAFSACIIKPHTSTDAL